MKLLALAFVLSLLIVVAAPSAAADPAASLQHLFASEECETVSGVTGDWAARGDLDGTWTVEEFPDHVYRLIEKNVQSGEPGKLAFDICFRHLGGYLFFDATAQIMTADGERSLLGDEETFSVALHIIGRFEVENDALHFRLLDQDWLQTELESGRAQLTHSEDDEGAFLITAPRKELQKFVTLFASAPGAFSDPEDFERDPGVEAERLHLRGRANAGTVCGIRRREREVLAAVRLHNAERWS
jgi:hypothetical protein